MTIEHRIGVKFDAVAIGLQVQVGDFDPMDIEALVTKAEQLLGSADPLARIITHFATQVQLVSFDMDRLAELGRDLIRQIDVMNMPAPVDPGRKDIYG